MLASMIKTQYSTGVSRQNIERALVAAGLDLAHLQPADLAPLEDFHTMGRIATHQLVDLLDITSDHHVLDAGSGSAALPVSSPTAADVASPQSI